MSDKKLSPEEMKNLFKAIGDLQQMQGELHAKKSRPLSDEEVKERVSRSDYGLCLANPIILDNVPFAYAFLENIKSPAGTPFVKEGRVSRQGEEGHIVDVYSGYYLNQSGERVKMEIFIDCYCSRSVPMPPAGWFGKNEQMKKTGCLIPLVAAIAVFVVGTALAVCL